jgi:hypothetical protein
MSQAMAALSVLISIFPPTGKIYSGLHKLSSQWTVILFRIFKTSHYKYQIKVSFVFLSVCGEAMLIASHYCHQSQDNAAIWLKMAEVS